MKEKEDVLDWYGLPSNLLSGLIISKSQADTDISVSVSRGEESMQCLSFFNPRVTLSRRVRNTHRSEFALSYSAGG